MLQKKKLTSDQALQRARLYCAYQERCHAETKEKLFSFGLPKNDLERIIAQLIEEDYLNEERFASAYARGKFRIKNWGKIRIRYELKQRRVSDYCISKAISEIDANEYMKTVKKLAEEKLKELNDEKNELLKKKKTIDYLSQKGYEREIIFSFFKELTL